MGLFDGLIAKMDGAVTSVESRAAGLVTSAESAVGVPASWLSAHLPAKPTAPVAAPWQGPRLPGATPQTSPAPVSPFNMVADMLAKIPGVGAVESLFGLTSPVGDHSADIQSWAQDLTRWANILKSLDGSMNQKDGASDLSGAYRSWQSGPYAHAIDLTAGLQNGHGSYESASAAHSDAVDQAKALQKRVQDRWAQFSSQDTPKVSDYARAIVDTGIIAGDRAVKATEKFGASAAMALDTSSSLFKYAPWILGGFAVLYVYGLSRSSGNPIQSLKRRLSR